MPLTRREKRLRRRLFSKPFDPKDFDRWATDTIFDGIDVHRRKKMNKIFWTRLKRKRRKKALKVSLVTARYRETNPLMDPLAIIGPDGKVLKVNSELGRRIDYSNFKIVTNTKVHLTGSPPARRDWSRMWDNKNPPPYNHVGPMHKLHATIPGGKYLGGFTLSTRGLAAHDASGSWWEYRGGFVDNDSWGPDSLSNYMFTSPPVLSGYDTLAWEHLKPKVSKASLTQTLVELRDLPRMLATSANAMWNSYKAVTETLRPINPNGGSSYKSIVMRPDNVADNYLNTEFGWIPFISDLQTLFDVYKQTEKYLSDLVRDNNTWVRKKRILEQSESDVLLHRYYTGACSPGGEPIDRVCKPYTLDGQTCLAHTDIRLRVNTRVWAVGYFKYYRPEFDARLASFSYEMTHIQRLLTLYGFRINPTIVYKLTPWSWLVDWFTQFGSFIQHHDEFVQDGIMSKSLCVMKTMRRDATKTVSINAWSGRVFLNWTRSLLIKQRKVADSPYGFDRPWQGLSTRQMAILGAIGTSQTNTGFISRGA